MSTRPRKCATAFSKRPNIFRSRNSARATTAVFLHSVTILPLHGKLLSPKSARGSKAPSSLRIFLGNVSALRMHLDEQEEKLLRSVALQNAQAVLFAREKAERELLATREALKASNQQVISILERVSDGFAALDNESRFTFLNRKCEEIFQRLKQHKTSFVGKNLWEEFPTLLGTEIEQHYRRAVRDQVTVEFETHLKPLNAWYIIRVYPS